MAKKIGAILLVILLIGLYVVGLVALLLGKSNATEIVLLSMSLSIILPTLIFLVYRFHLLAKKTFKDSLKNDSDDDEK